MKKLMLMICLTLLTCVSVDAKMRYRHLEGNDVFMETKSFFVAPFGKKTLNFSVTYDSQRRVDGCAYLLDVRYNTRDRLQSLSDGRRLLLRLGDESVLELSDCGEKNLLTFSTEVVMSPSPDRRTSTYVNGSSLYTFHGRYALTDEQYRSLIGNGIAKIRVETDGDLIEAEYDEKLQEKIRKNFQTTDELLEFHMDPTKNM